MSQVTRIPDDWRLEMICRRFQNIVFDNAVFNVADQIAEHYDGGLWEYYQRDGQFFYMVPDTDTGIDISVPGNYFQGRVSSDAFGLICTLTALGQVLMHLHSKGQYELGHRLNDYFHELRIYAIEHPEAEQIMRAID